jgi:hypothetical protein
MARLAVRRAPGFTARNRPFPFLEPRRRAGSDRAVRLPLRRRRSAAARAVEHPLAGVLDMPAHRGPRRVLVARFDRLEQHDVLGLDGAQMLERPGQGQTAREIDRELDRRSHRMQHRLEILVARSAGDAEMKLEIGLHGDDAVRGRRPHLLQSFANCRERRRRMVLCGVKGRLAFHASPEFEALPDRGETVDRQEARRADRRQRGASKSRLFS